MRTGRHNAITDVAGIRVGQHQRTGDGWATGVTAVLAPDGTVGGVDVRGGAPSTRETDLLDPSRLVQHVDAVLLCGGSAYGLAAADGAMRWLAEQPTGFPVGTEAHQVVPIVPAAVLFDLPMGDWGNVPDAEFGYLACAAATGEPPAQGCAGAGTGAIAGRLKGGVGSASVVLDDDPAGTAATVGALMVANPMGDVVDPATGLPYAADLGVGDEFGLRRPSAADVAAAQRELGGVTRTPLNTTIGVVATDAELTKAECRLLATVAHDGLARAVRPAHSQYDGDTVFVLATGAVRLPAGAERTPRLNALAEAAAGVVARAVVHAVLAATPAGGVSGYRQRYPSSG